ncbi:MAG: C40 family peptidase [Prevotella sp.]|nr:C40 family peptidase [Prevotella sp.]
METRKIIAMIALLLLIAAPILADKDKDNNKSKSEEEDMYDEIDNYDFLYNGEGMDFDGYSFSKVCNVMDEAFSHIGDRYRSGQSGPYTFDCSGFTRYVFGQSGITLSHSSREQYNEGESVEKKDLQTGDLVFFKSPGSGRSIGHVGIVVDVNQENGTFSFIHASSKKGIIVSSSTEDYYAHRYVGARRVM